VSFIVATSHEMKFFCPVFSYPSFAAMSMKTQAQYPQNQKISQFPENAKKLFFAACEPLLTVYFKAPVGCPSSRLTSGGSYIKRDPEEIWMDARIMANRNL
jgi:hypothetical protein